jgi:hypothetical protein
VIPQLEEMALNNPLIESFAWITSPMNNIVPQVSSITIANIGHSFFSNQILLSASPNIYSVTIDGFLVDSERYPSPDKFTIVEDLYSVRGSHSMVLGSVYRDNIGIELPDQFLLQTVVSASPYDIVDSRRLKALAFLDASPSFSFSQFPSVLLSWYLADTFR